MTFIDRLGAIAVRFGERGQATPKALRVFAVHGAAAAALDLSSRLVPWLHGLDTPFQLALLTDRLEGADVRPLGPASAEHGVDADLANLGKRVARDGLVRRSLYLTLWGSDADAGLSGLVDAGLLLERLDASAVAALTRRLLLAAPMAGVLEGASADAGWCDPTSPGAASGQSRLGDGERTLRQLSLPDQVHVLPGHLDGDCGSAVLLYVDGLPRELEADALAAALRMPEPVDVSLRLWPLPGDEVVRHLTRRLRDLRATQAMGGDAVADVRLATAVDDAERLREALYLGQTRLIQIGIVLAARGADHAAALAVASRLRARLARLGFLPRLAVLRQWAALASMLPGAPDRLGAGHNVTSQAAARLLPLSLALPPANGILLGRDEHDHTAVHLDRTALANPAAIYLGAPGSGKSSLAKMEILRRARLARDDRFLVVDPEGEYGRVVTAIAGGAEIDVAHAGALRLPLLPAIAPDAAPAVRAGRAATLLAPLVGAAGDLGRARLARALEAMLSTGHGDLSDLPAALRPLDPRLADDAMAAIAGPLAVLAGGPPPSPGVRALSLNLSAVDTLALPALLPVLTEAAVGHLTTGVGRGAGWLWLTLDEFHLYLERETGARLLVELAKRARKRGIVLTAVTQHLVDLLRHPDGQAILAACETVALFRPGVDLEPFTDLLRLDERAARQTATLAPGQALLRIGERLRLVRIALSPAEAAAADTRPTPLRQTNPTGGTGHAALR